MRATGNFVYTTLTHPTKTANGNTNRTLRTGVLPLQVMASSPFEEIEQITQKKKKKHLFLRKSCASAAGAKAAACAVCRLYWIYYVPLKRVGRGTASAGRLGAWRWFVPSFTGGSDLGAGVLTAANEPNDSREKLSFWECGGAKFGFPRNRSYRQGGRNMRILANCVNLKQK